MQETLKVVHSNSWKDSKDEEARSERGEAGDTVETTISKDDSGDLFVDMKREDEADDDSGKDRVAERTNDDEPELLSGVRIEDEDTRNTLVASETTEAAPTPVSLRETLWNPLLAVAAVLAVLAAGWSYTSLQGTRAQLSAMADAKASVERTLADVKTRLSAAEKTVSDIRAALAASAAVAATASESAPAAAASEATPEAAAPAPVSADSVAQ